MDGTFVYRRRVALDAMPGFAVHRHEGSPIDKAPRNKQGRAKRATLLLQKELLLFVILSFSFIIYVYKSSIQTSVPFLFPSPGF
jgi:hypothetical protein